MRRMHHDMRNFMHQSTRLYKQQGEYQQQFGKRG